LGGRPSPAKARNVVSECYVTRQAISGNDGRFVFDGVQPGAPYVIRGELTGFRSDSVHDIAVTGGETRTIDLELELGCVNDEPGIRIPDLDELLEADAIAHVRVAMLVKTNMTAVVRQMRPS